MLPRRKSQGTTTAGSRQQGGDARRPASELQGRARPRCARRACLAPTDKEPIVGPAPCPLAASRPCPCRQSLLWLPVPASAQACPNTHRADPEEPNNDGYKDDHEEHAAGHAQQVPPLGPAEHTRGGGGALPNAGVSNQSAGRHAEPRCRGARPPSLSVHSGPGWQALGAALSATRNTHASSHVELSKHRHQREAPHRCARRGERDQHHLACVVGGRERHGLQCWREGEARLAVLEGRGGTACSVRGRGRHGLQVGSPGKQTGGRARLAAGTHARSAGLCLHAGFPCRESARTTQPEITLFVPSRPGPGPPRGSPKRPSSCRSCPPAPIQRG